MDSARATVIAPNDIEALFQSVVRGERGQKLRTQLAGQHPESSAEEIEEAIQVACKRFVDKAEGISAPGQVYTWIRTTAHRVLGREAGYQAHERPVDPSEVALQALVSKEPGPAEELIAHEDEVDLARLAEEVSSSLSERRRDVLALYGAGLLTDVDREVLPCGAPRWQARLGKAGSKLKRAGCLKADSSWGRWELAAAGIERLRRAEASRHGGEAGLSTAVVESEAIAA